MQISSQIQKLIDDGALFVINHSGGKDSQCMYLLLRDLIPADQLVVVHATLGEVEWQGTIEHIQATIGDSEFHVCRNVRKDFLSMVEQRGKFPSNSCRQCTSDLKRDPIATLVRGLCRAKGKTKIVNCMGLRAQESPARAKKETFKISKRFTTAGRTWFEWLPIHDLSIDQVFETIAAKGQKPHWAYACGMSRLSCSFCILASAGDLTRAAQLRPELYAKYVALEKKIGHTLQMSGLPLTTITGIAV